VPCNDQFVARENQHPRALCSAPEAASGPFEVSGDAAADSAGHDGAGPAEETAGVAGGVDGDEAAVPYPRAWSPRNAGAL